MRIVFAAAGILFVACSPHADMEGGGGWPASGDDGTSPDASSVSSSGGGASSSSSSSSSGGGGGGDGGAANAPAATCTKSSKSYGGGLGMWECVPSKPAASAGLVVAMHGYTQGVEQPSSPGGAWGYKPTTQWAVLAEKYGFYVVFPDKGTSSFQWYAFYGTSGIGRSDIEPSAIKTMVDDMRAKYTNIAADKVFANGLSAGAYMTVVMLATYPDVFAAGATFAGGAYGCSTSCAALGKKGQGWTWPGNHASSLVTGAYPTVWQSASARKPRLMIFQGDADGAVTPENLADLTAQWKGAIGVSGSGTVSTLKGHELTEYSKNGAVVISTVLMKGMGHGTPVDPGSGVDQGGWDPVPSQTASADPNAVQDWTNTAGIYGPYYAGKFFGLVP